MCSAMKSSVNKSSLTAFVSGEHVSVISLNIGFEGKGKKFPLTSGPSKFPHLYLAESKPNPCLGP